MEALSIEKVDIERMLEEMGGKYTRQELEEAFTASPGTPLEMAAESITKTIIKRNDRDLGHILRELERLIFTNLQKRAALRTLAGALFLKQPA